MTQPKVASTARQAQRWVLQRVLRTEEGVLLLPGREVRLERPAPRQYGMCDVVATVDGREVRRRDVMATCVLELEEDEPRWVPVPEGQSKFATGTQLRSPEGKILLVGDVDTDRAAQEVRPPVIAHEKGWQMTVQPTET